MGVDDQVYSPGMSVFEENFVPSLASITGTKHSALGIRSVWVAESGNVHKVGIFWIDTNA